MTDDEIIQQAGTEWNKLRGTMADYLSTVIRLAEAHERNQILKLADSSGWISADAIRARGEND